MEIEFDIDLMRNKLRSSFVDFGVDRIIQQELNKIVEKHKKAAVDEIQKFVALVLVSDRMKEFGTIQKVRIKLPDLDTSVQTPSVVT